MAHTNSIDNRVINGVKTINSLPKQLSPSYISEVDYSVLAISNKFDDSSCLSKCVFVHNKANENFRKCWLTNFISWMINTYHFLLIEIMFKCAKECFIQISLWIFFLWVIYKKLVRWIFLGDQTSNISSETHGSHVKNDETGFTIDDKFQKLIVPTVESKTRQDLQCISQ